MISTQKLCSLDSAKLKSSCTKPSLKTALRATSTRCYGIGYTGFLFLAHCVYLVGLLIFGVLWQCCSKVLTRGNFWAAILTVMFFAFGYICVFGVFLIWMHSNLFCATPFYLSMAKIAVPWPAFSKVKILRKWFFGWHSKSQHSKYRKNIEA